MKQIGHEQKKEFKAKIFALLKDFSNDKNWSAEEAKELETLINTYSKIDKEFVKRTLTYYEKKIGQRLSAALYAAKGD